ncbi:MAG: uracil-DNA glycosylase family protein [Candidatus Hydrogenedentota bacterium]
MKITTIARRLSKAANDLTFSPPVTHIYNPLSYARRSNELYIDTFAQTPKEVLFLGMNPGPFGMAQTGVPFGEVSLVRDWMGIEAKVDRPDDEHPKRPIQGFDCTRSEVSGARLWGWARDRFGTADAFFERFFVWNYCPLVFMTETGANFTPDKLPKAEQKELFDICDTALRSMVNELHPKWVIGVGKFAEKRALHALPDFTGHIGTILHPSPASPAANRGWAQAAEKQLKEMGIL